MRETSLSRLAFLTGLVPVGSRVTCDPMPPSADVDYLALIHDGIAAQFYAELQEGRWEIGGSLIPDDGNRLPREERFQSYRLDDINIIATRSDVFFRRFLAATSVAKRLNLLDKEDRIALFQAVLYGNECAPAVMVNETEEPF